VGFVEDHPSGIHERDDRRGFFWRSAVKKSVEPWGTIVPVPLLRISREAVSKAWGSGVYILDFLAQEGETILATTIDEPYCN